MDLEKEKTVILEMLNATAEAFKKGDLSINEEHFLQTNDLRIVTPYGISQGWESLKKRAATNNKKYEVTDTVVSNIEVEMLSEKYAFVKGLTERTLDGVKQEVYTSTLLMRDSGKWKSLHSQDTIILSK